MALIYNFPKTIVETFSPSVNNDISQGIIIGTQWINTVTKESFTCFDNQPGAAFWDKNLASAGNVSNVEFITLSASKYEFLLLQSPFINCHFNIFSKEQDSLWAGDFTFDAINYKYNVGPAATLQTGNIIPSGVSTRYFFVVLNTNAVYTTEYSLDNIIWIPFISTQKIDLGFISTELYIRFTFINSGSCYDYGVLVNPEQGIYNEFVEASRNVHYAIEIQTAGSAQTVFDLSTFTFTPSAGELDVFKNGLHICSDEYMELDSNTFALNTPTASGGTPDIIFAQINKDETNEPLHFHEYIYDCTTTGITEISTSFNFIPNNNELIVYKNGYRVFNFTEHSGNKIIFDAELQIGDVVCIKVAQILLNINATQEIDKQLVSNGQTIVYLPFEFINDGQHLHVYADGILIVNTEYTEPTTSSIIFDTPLSGVAEVALSIYKY